MATKTASKLTIPKKRLANRAAKPAPPVEGTTKSMWEKIDELVASVPAEEWAKLPKDGSMNHDHYLYGSPKQVP